MTKAEEYDLKIVLYQIIPELDTKRLMFNCIESIMKSCGDKFPAEIYELVFSGDVEAKSCDEVWTIFNTNLPNGYKGRSMSVSDVVEIIDSDKQSKFFFCDSFGFKEIDFNKKKVMTLVLNHNYDCVQEKRKNVSVFFIAGSGLLQVKCKEFELTRCKFSQTQLGYRLIFKKMDGRVLNYSFSERPSIIVSECKEDFPRELLYIDSKRTRYTVHDKSNLSIVCSWLARKGYAMENLYGGCIT